MTLLSLLSILFFSYLHFAPTHSSLTIQTQYGPVTGFTKDGADVWWGIPFARPPIGQYRFKPPQAPTPWRTAVNCTEHHRCSQLDVDNLVVAGREDCLYLDIYRPAGATGPLPVMFWIYGGGYVVGDSWEFSGYEGIKRVVDYPVVIVNVNYRLGPFGFLGLKESLTESGTTGNYGVQDQRFAMQWVQKNIASFGGDPNQVTIWGESAGAFSVCYHLSSAASKGLFRAAIMESGTCDSKEFFSQLDLVDSWSADVAAWASCNRSLLTTDKILTCLRTTTTEVWMYTVKSWFTGDWDKSGTGFRPLLAPVMPWGPAIDGSASGLQDLPLELIKRGVGSQVPVIAGTNADEGSIFVPAMPLIVPGVTFPFQEKDLFLTLMHFFDNDTQLVDSILLRYPLRKYKDVSEQAAIILRDYFFVCATRRLHRAENSHSVPSWQYHFTYEYHYPAEYVLFGDFHASELKYVWDDVHRNETANDQKMVDTFGVYWTNQAIYKSPNGAPSGGQPTWQVYSSSADNLMNMTVTPYQLNINNMFTSICDFWDTIYPNRK
eukprot:TRINITY_DN873_c0_g1_i1.p1 TRINITY_DN873_c0_g1~~TRINITY_DN873_c0_g1_i1.p1  ORF type:complete len:563 (-),score=121.50 TRINITY_DN873_c0_g1_i1:28-1668(-)